MVPAVLRYRDLCLLLPKPRSNLRFTGVLPATTAARLEVVLRALRVAGTKIS